MAAIRNHCRLLLARRAPTTSLLSRRYATQSYGGSASGYPDDTSAPRRDLEHPGPPAPDTTGSKPTSSSVAGQPSDGPLSSTNASSDLSSAQGTKPRPANPRPESAAEADSPDVRKHNEEMRDRADKPMNQLSQADSKVS